IQKARQEFADIPLSSMTIKNPNTKRAEIELRAAYSQSLLKRGSAETVSFNLSSGKVIEPEYRATTVAREVYSVLTTLHVGRGAESLLRWLLF
ncbi:PepSY domain-containing protein, partial [Acinetobacter gyllenbergii]